MNTLKKKYNCNNVVVAGEMTGGVSLEKLVTKIPEPNSSSNSTCSGQLKKNDAGTSHTTSLTRSISLIAPSSSYNSQVRQFFY